MNRYTIRHARLDRWCEGRAADGCERLIVKRKVYVESVISPHHDDLGNLGWRRMALCVPCARYFTDIPAAVREALP